MRLLELFAIVENRIDFLRDKWSDILNEQAKKTPNDIAYAKRYGRDDVFSILMKVDPNPNKQFLGWLISRYLKGTFLLEDGYKITESLVLFIKFKQQLPVTHRDINKYPDVSSLYDVVKKFEELQTQGEVNKELQIKMHSLPNAEVVFNDAEMKVIIPKTVEAACFHGTNTKWCTSVENNTMFDYYSKRGPLYIILIKAENKRFQFAFESNQFMDEQDRPIVLMDIITKYPKIRAVFKDKIDKAIIKKNPTNITNLPGVSKDSINYAIELRPELLGALVPNPTEVQRLAAVGTKPKLLSTLMTPEEDKIDTNINRLIAHYEYSDVVEKFGTILEQYEVNGLTVLLYSRIWNALSEFDLEIEGYKISEQAFIIESWVDKNNFVEHRLGNTAKWVTGLLSGEGNEFYDADISEEDIKTGWDSMSMEDREKVGKDIVEEAIDHLSGYDKDEVKEYFSSFDYSSYSDIYTFLDDTNDPNDDRLSMVTAALRGAERGAEDQMDDSLEEYFKDLSPSFEDYEELDIINNLELYISVINWNSPVYMLAGEKSLIQLASFVENSERPELGGYAINWDDIKFDDLHEPNYGWHGFSANAAVEAYRDDYHYLFKN